MNELKKIYISGKISGLPEEEAIKIFDLAEEALKSLAYEVINPMKLPHNHSRTWEAYMKEDIAAMMNCDAVMALENWSESKGAKIEVGIAKSIGMPVYFANEDLTKNPLKNNRT
jgi:nucleoside 2-deoxyribosyltransferase